MAKFKKKDPLEWNHVAKEFQFENELTLSNACSTSNGSCDVTGYHLEHGKDWSTNKSVIYIQPINSKGWVSYGGLRIPTSEIHKLIAALQEFKDSI